MSQRDYFPQREESFSHSSRRDVDSNSQRRTSYYPMPTPASDHSRTNQSFSQTGMYPYHGDNNADPSAFQTPYQAHQSIPVSNYDVHGQSSSDTDPFAGQYPPPRQPSGLNQAPHAVDPVYPAYSANEYPVNGNFPMPQQYQKPGAMNDDQATVHTANSAHTRSSAPSMTNSNSYTRQNSSHDGHDTSNLMAGAVGVAAGAGLVGALHNKSPDKGYYDPHAIPLTEWQQAERTSNIPPQENEFRNNAMSPDMADPSNGREAYMQDIRQQPQPEPLYAEAGYPTVAPPSYLRPDRDGYLPGARGRTPKQRPAGAVVPQTPVQNQHYPPPPPVQPYQPQLMPPPQAYKPPRDSRGGCCYCPALTCCSFFCMLISVGFLAAGIAMIVYAKVASESCPPCNSKSALSGICNACNSVLYDGLFYGGIAVAALAGIGIIWRLFMWCCSARRY